MKERKFSINLNELNSFFIMATKNMFAYFAATAKNVAMVFIS